MKRKGLSVQVKTGNKHRPTAELLPRMKNFHRHSIYQMAYLDPWVCFDIQFLRISGIFWKIWKHAKILFNLCGQIFENENLGSKTHGRSILKTAVFDMGLRPEIYLYCFLHSAYKAFYSYTFQDGIDMLPKRLTPVDQTLESESTHYQLSVAIFMAARNLLGARKSLI